MSIAKVYERKIMQSVLLDFLNNLKVPSEPEINRRMADLLLVANPADPNSSITLDLFQPVLSQKDLNFSYREDLSASRVNQLMGTVHADFDVLYDAALQIEREHLGTVFRTMQDMDDLSRQIEELTSEINRLLLLTEETEGTLHVLGDSFQDDSKIDKTVTTALIDLEKRRIKLKRGTGTNVHTEDYNLGRVQNREIRPQVLISGANLNELGVRSQIFTPDNNPWIAEVRVAERVNVVLGLVIDFSGVMESLNLPITTREIHINPYIGGISVQVLLQYSADGITWNEIPVAEPVRRSVGPITYTCNEISFKYLRILMAKDTHDERTQQDQYIYRFGISNLKITRNLNDHQLEGVFQSTRHLPLTPEGEPFKFTKAVISDACYEQPTDTSIDFYISMLIRDGQNELIETEFQKIMPLGSALETGVDAVTATISAVSRIGSSPAKMMRKGERPNDWSDDYEVELGEGQNKALVVEDLAVGKPISGSTEDNLIEVWRSIGNNDYFKTVKNEKGAIIEQGWRLLSDGRYATYVYVDDPGGMQIDFGDFNIEIDDRTVRNVVHLTSGLHYIKVEPERWSSLEGLTDITAFNVNTRQFKGATKKYDSQGLGSNLATTAAQSISDPKYPYNHKLLIEGLNYAERPGVQYEGERIYTGVSRYAGHYMRQVSVFEMENIESNDYDSFCVVDVIEKSQDPIIRSKGIMINLDQNLVDGENNDTVTVVTRPSTATMAEGLIFKAILNTEVAKNSPSLEGYEIKIVQ